MSEKMTVSQTAVWLKTNDNFLLLTHRRPDGDTLGSAGALAQGLHEAGKTVFILFNPETTPRYSRFAKDHWSPEGFKPEHIIAIDTASSGMLQVNSAEYAEHITLCIDHHPSNTEYATYTCLDGERSSCGEIIYDILKEMSGYISAKTAGCLYAAVSTDTGCFVFANTTADTLRVASNLIEDGAPHRELNRLLFRTKTLGRIKMEGMIYSGLEFYFDGQVAISVISRRMLATAEATEDDIDDIASIPGSIEGIRVGVTIRELTSETDCKVSVRTGTTVNANAICALFGGGGHAMAAGYSVKATVDDIRESLLKALKDFLP